MKVVAWIAGIIGFGVLALLLWAHNMPEAQKHEMNVRATNEATCERLQIGADTGAQRLAAKDLCDRMRASR